MRTRFPKGSSAKSGAVLSRLNRAFTVRKFARRNHGAELSDRHLLDEIGGWHIAENAFCCSAFSFEALANYFVDCGFPYQADVSDSRVLPDPVIPVLTLRVQIVAPGERFVDRECPVREREPGTGSRWIGYQDLWPLRSLEISRNVLSIAGGSAAVKFHCSVARVP